MTSPPSPTKSEKRKKREIYEEYLETYDLENIISEMTNSVVHSQDPNPIVYMIKYLTGLLTEDERIEFKINIEPPYPQGVPIVKFPSYKNDNILSKYLTKSNWGNYKYRKTRYNNDINNLTYLSEHNSTDRIGLILVDKDCLDTFKDLIEPIVYTVHNIDEKKRNSDVLYRIGNSPKLYKSEMFFFNEMKNNLKQIKLILMRNIEGYTYNNIDKRNGKLKDKIDQEMLAMQSEGYLPNDLKKIEKNEEKEAFINNERLLLKEYNWMKSAGFVNKGYSLNDRSIWVNKDKSLIILINFANHFELILTINEMEEENIKKNYNYIMNILNHAKLKLTFDISPRFGYITSNIEFLGAGFSIFGIFSHENVQKREEIIKNREMHYEIDKNNLIFTECYHLNLNYNILLSFIKNSFAFGRGFQILCDKLYVKLDKEKIKLKKSNSIVAKAYESTYAKGVNELDILGKNINEFIKYYKQSETEDDLLFTSEYCYLIFERFIFKYIYLRDNIDLELANYLSKPDNPKSLVNIDPTEFFESLINIKVCLSRNINDFPFPLCPNYNSYNAKALEIIKNALNDFNKKLKIGTFMTIEEAEAIIKEKGIPIFHDEKKIAFFEYDRDYPKNRGFIKFEKPNIFATINDLNSINFILSINNGPNISDEEKNIIKSMENLLMIVNKFSSKIKFAFSHKYGFMTSCLKYMGNGIKISADLKVNEMSKEDLDNFVKNKYMTYKILSENKDEKIIRLENKGSFISSETELLCDWIYSLNELILP